MASTYTLRVRTEFAAAHHLRGYDGDCSRLHGHNWRVEVEVSSDQLDAAGMVIDFRQLRRHARAIGERLDHRYLNEVEPFTEQNPTAENIAAHFFDAMKDRLADTAVHINAVTIWENERSCVRYTEQEA